MISIVAAAYNNNTVAAVHPDCCVRAFALLQQSILTVRTEPLDCLNRAYDSSNRASWLFEQNIQTVATDHTTVQTEHLDCSNRTSGLLQQSIRQFKQSISTVQTEHLDCSNRTTGLLQQNLCTVSTDHSDYSEPWHCGRRSFRLSNNRNPWSP